MKKTILLLFFAIRAVIFSQNSSLAWNENYLVKSQTTDIEFVNGFLGFAIIQKEDERSRVIKTTDGGKSWNVLPAVFDEISSLSVVNENTIWLSTPTKGVFVTNNGGNTWKNLNFKKYTQLFSEHNFLTFSEVKFFDQSNGYISFGNNQEKLVLKTTNGGKIWKKINLPHQSSDLDGSSFKFVTNTTIYHIAHSVNDGYLLYKSVDKGEHWVKLNFPSSLKQELILSNFGMMAQMPDMKFINEETAIIFSYNFYENESVYKTSNSGTSWQKINFPYERNNVVFNASNTGYLLSENKLYVSNDLGENWSLLNVDLGDYVNKLFIEKGKLYISGYDGLRLLNSDNSVAHVLFNRQTQALVENFHFEQNGYAYSLAHYEKGFEGDDQFMLVKYKLDGTQIKQEPVIFHTQNDLQLGDLEGVKKNPSGTAFLTYPSLFKSDVNFKDWYPLTDTTSSLSFLNLEFFDDNLVFAIDDNHIYSSSNQGEKWDVVFNSKQQGSGLQSMIFTDLQILKNGVILVLGSKNQYLRSEDRGQTWKVLQFPVSQQNFNQDHKMFFIDQNIGWVNTFEALLKTKDSGKTWFVVSKDDQINMFTNILFTDENHGFSSNYYTVDGGKTWKEILDASYIGSNQKLDYVNKQWVSLNAGEFSLINVPNCISDININLLDKNHPNIKDVEISWNKIPNTTSYDILVSYSKNLLLDNFDTPLRIGKTSGNSIIFEDVDIQNEVFMKSLDKKLYVMVVPSNEGYRNTTCKNIVSYDLDGLETLGVSEIELNKTIVNDVFVYPNPTTSGVLSVISNAAIVKVEVVSLSGISLLESDKSVIDVRNLPIGVYFAKVYLNEHNFTVKKFIKKY